MRHWLFKTEPHVYSVEHLAAAPSRTGVWDGIRNYQARNFLRDCAALGDRVFIYHCQCPQPGIYGTALIRKAAYADPAQYDSESDYFDPKASRENPRWVCVDIQLEHRLPRSLSVQDLKAHPELSALGIFKQPRLSVVPVSDAESSILLSLIARDR